MWFCEIYRTNSKARTKIMKALLKMTTITLLLVELPFVVEAKDLMVHLTLL